MRKKSKRRSKRSGKKQNSLLGLLLLEAIGVVAVLSLVEFSQSARSEQPMPKPARESVNYWPSEREKTLPKLASWRYNTEPNSEYAFPESFYGSRPHSR